MRAAHLIAKLECYVRLSREEKAALSELTSASSKVLGPRQDLVREHDKPRRVNLIVEGWACRYIDLEDGRRQIVALLLPGDLCDLGLAHLAEMDHTIGAISEITVAEIPFDQFEHARSSFQRLNLALQWNALVEVAIAREWVLSIGQRSASERLAHLFCELRCRLRATGSSQGENYAFPMTQQQLAEATGLSSVHVNRSLQQLRGKGLIVLRERTLTVLDVEGLEAFALFDPGYLHLDREGRQFDAND